MPAKRPIPRPAALRLPLHMATTFKLPPFGGKLFDALTLASPAAPHAYTRWSNPTIRALEERLAALEGTEAALVTASGMAAVSTLIFTLLSAGDHLVASEVCYAGSVELFGLHLPRFGIEVSLVDTSDVEQVRAALRPNTKLLYVETPANPILRIADIARLAGVARSAGIPLAVDSTWAGPALQRPAALGADYVVHSLTKYMNGHGDALGGTICGRQPRSTKSGKTRWSTLAAPPARSMPGSSCGDSRPCPSGCASTRRARSRSRSFSKVTGGSNASSTRD